MALLARSSRERGYPLLLVGATIESPDYPQRLREAIQADDQLVVRVDAPPEALKARIEAREPPEWTGLERLLNAIDDLATRHAGLDGIDLVLNTADTDPTAVAATIRDAIRARWPLSSSGRT